MLRFHIEVWQRTDEYSRNRQQTRRHSPLTVLRWIWGATSAPVCRMVLMMNLDTFEGALDNLAAMSLILSFATSPLDISSLFIKRKR